MAGAEGQGASHASSSHWESRLLQGHLYRRPDWAHWKVGRGEGDEGGGKEWRGDMWKRKGSERLDDKEMFAFFKAPAIMRILPPSQVASFQLSKNTGKFRAEP